MTVLVLSPRYTDDSNNLRRAALELGWQVERPHGWRPPEGLPRAEVCLYGEPLFCSLVAESLDLALVEPTNDWLPSLPRRWRSREIALTTLGEARALAAPRFVKPADEKCFPARVYASGAELPRVTGLDEATPALVSEPVRFVVEFRAFVMARAVAALSPYIRGGDLAQGASGAWSAGEGEWEGARAYVDALVADPAVALPPAVVVDVGLTDDRGWVAVEANPCFASGLCACDPLDVLPVLRRACLPREAAQGEDARWVIARG